MNTVSKIDSRAIGEAEEDAESLAQAEADALMISASAGVRPEAVERYVQLSKLGSFFSLTTSRFIIANTVQTLDVMDGVMRKIADRIERNAETMSPDKLAKLVDAMSSMNNSKANANAILLKAVEIGAAGKKKRKRQSNAPESITGIEVSVGGVTARAVSKSVEGESGGD